MRAPPIALVTIVFGGLTGACADDPQYVNPPVALEANAPGAAEDAPLPATTIQLPVELESEEDATERGELAAELGVDVPYVRVDDLSISLEWTIRNLEDRDGEARIHLNGGNEYFTYVPANFVIDPEEDEEPPPLVGDIPITIGPLATRSGVFREDQLLEAAIDLELITRGATNPFAAILQVHEDIEQIDDGAGVIVPREAFAHMVQFDLSFEANRHMVLEYALRVRDHRGMMHELLLDAPGEELTVFAPAEFAPPPPPM